MRRKSHKTLGKYLAEHYFPHTPKRYVRAFLIGCVEPDRNPTTYLKGSLCREFLRGHNYENAFRYMARVAKRLERKRVWKLFDYYTMGKLIHYTTDAFTYAHNTRFGTSLTDHRAYERALQAHFLTYLQEAPEIHVRTFRSVIDAISAYHGDYDRSPMDIRTDARFVLGASCCVLVTLLAI